MEFDTSLVQKVHRAADIWTFRFDKPPEYEYQAGQWGVIDMERDDIPLSHHFTHSSSPTEPFLELTTRVRDSEFKQALSQLVPGARVHMEGPFGSFVLRDDGRPAVFLTGGIGITPVRSILRSLAANGANSGESVSEVTLLFANRDEDEIPFKDELASLTDQLPGLSVVHVLSRPSDSWSGERGHLGEEILQKHLPSLSGRTFYVSGPPSLVQSMRDLLDAMHVSGDDVVAEKFDGYE